MANVLLAGNVLTGAGAAVVGATVEVFDRNTTTPVRATYAGGSGTSGEWSFSYAPGANSRRVDVRVTNGSSVSFLKFDDQVQVSSVETASLRILNPAFTFEYDIVPAAITAARQLNLPLITATKTLAVTGNASGVPDNLTLLRVNSGTSTTTAAHNLDTVEITGLVAGDMLEIHATVDQLTGNAVGTFQAYNNTDAVAIIDLLGSAGVLVATDYRLCYVVIMQSQQADTTIRSLGISNDTTTVIKASSTFTTPWTSTWTLAFRSGGQAAGATHRWRWSVWKRGSV